MKTTTATPASRVHTTAILAIILVSYFMIILDNSIIFTGLPRIQAEMNLSATSYGAVAGIGAGLGLVVGGALAEWVSWRAGFYVNVPIGIAMIIAAVKFIPDSPPTSGRFDLIGAVASTLGMGALVFAIVNSVDSGWAAPETITALVAAAVLLTLLVLNEWRVKQPIMPLHLFAGRERTGAYSARLLFAGTMIGFFFFTTQFLQGVYGYNPLEAGVAFFPPSPPLRPTSPVSPCGWS